MKSAPIMKNPRSLAEQSRLKQVGRDRWLQGLDDDCPDAHSCGEVLRLNPSDPSEVQSSSGGRIPTELCRRQFAALGCREMRSNQADIGLYLCDDGRGDITEYLIGAAEVRRFVKILWPDILWPDEA